MQVGTDLSVEDVIKFVFLSDPSLIIGYPCHSLIDDSDCRLVGFIDVTLACEGVNSKHVEVVTVVDVSAEDRVGNRFGC